MKKFFVLASCLITLLGLSACQKETVSCVVNLPLNSQSACEGTQQNVIWLPSETFGFTADFSTEESSIILEECAFDYTKDFTISVWVKAPQRDTKGRTLVSMGAKNEFRLYLDEKADNELILSIKGLAIESSGVSLTDGQWHHVAVSKADTKVHYYVDGALVKMVTAEGTMSPSGNQTLYIGSDTNKIHSFDGSMAELKIAQCVVTPDKMSSVSILATDNEQKAPTWNYKRGVVIDRPQYASTLIPLSYTEKQDLINCRDMGFDHVKLQLTPEWMIDDEGHLIEENLAYIDSIVDMCVELDYPCILCVSPCADGLDYDFKSVYLGDLDMFEKLCLWYKELGEHIARKGWSAQLVALQLMTEPNSNNPSVSWSYMSDRMYGAVRNVLPYHTLITSANQSGNIEYLKKMSPATDDNLIYSFTTYEPYAVGWSSAYTSQVGEESFWNYVGEIPYPIEEGVDYTDAILEAIKDVPEEYYSRAKTALTNYVKGKYDGGSATWTNLYDSLYNREWHFERAKSLYEWSEKNGGNIHIMAVEFGAYDSLYSTDRLGSIGKGISDEKRLELIQDLRESFEAYDIGWCYWSYNEGFTAFTPAYHVDHVGASPSAEEAAAFADYDLLTKALGLTPTLTPTADESVYQLATDQKLIADFESYHNIWGTDIDWDGHVISASTDFRSTLVFCFISPWRDYAYYLENGGKLHLRIYVSDASHVRKGQIELSTSATPNDTAEYAWEIRSLNLQDGWNDIELDLSTCASHNGDLSDIKTIRVYLVPSGPITMSLDDFWLSVGESS